MVFHSVTILLSLFVTVARHPEPPLLTESEISRIREAVNFLIPHTGVVDVEVTNPLSIDQVSQSKHLRVKFPEVEVHVDPETKEWTHISFWPVRNRSMVEAWTEPTAKGFAESVVQRVFPNEAFEVKKDGKSQSSYSFKFFSRRWGFPVAHGGASVTVDFEKGFVRFISRFKAPASFRPAIVTWDKATLKQRAEEYVRSRETGNWKAHNDFEIGYFIPNCESNREYASAYHYTETDKRDSVQRIARLMATVWVEFAGPDAPASRNSRYVLTFDVEAGKLKMAVPMPPW